MCFVIIDKVLVNPIPVCLVGVKEQQPDGEESLLLTLMPAGLYRKVKYC